MSHLSAAYPSREMINLESKIAPDYGCKRQFAKYLKVPHLPNIVMYKIIWEQIRITGSRRDSHKLRIGGHDVRRRMSDHEKGIFVEFASSLGNMDDDFIQQELGRRFPSEAIII